MFQSKRLPFSAVTKIDKILDKLRSRYLAFVTFVTVLLLGVASPAHAAGPSAVTAAGNVNFMCYIGSPTLDIFDPAKSATQKLTGYGLGLVIVIAAVGVVWGGIRIMTSGKHSEKAEAGVRQLSTTVLGLIVIFGGLTVLGILVAILVTLNSYGC